MINSLPPCNNPKCKHDLAEHGFHSNACLIWECECIEYESPDRHYPAKADDFVYVRISPSGHMYSTEEKEILAAFRERKEVSVFRRIPGTLWDQFVETYNQILTSAPVKVKLLVETDG